MGKRRSIRCVWCGSLNTKKYGKIKRTEFYLKSTKQKKIPRDFIVKTAREHLVGENASELNIPSICSLK